MAGLAAPARAKFTDENGALSGGKIFTFFAGTSRACDSFTDYTGTAKNTNPIILDANGECDLWFDGMIKIRVERADGSLVWVRDNIPSVASVGDNTVLPKRVSYVGDGAQDVFDVSAINAYSIETMLVTVDGALLEPGIDYTLDAQTQTITTSVPVPNTKTLVIRSFGFATAFNFSTITETYTSAAGQQDFPLVNHYAVGANAIQVFVNSGRLIPADFTEIDAQTVRINTPLNLGDVVLFVTSEIIGSAGKIVDGSVTTTKIAPLAVTDSRIADKAVVERTIDDGAVSSRTIAAGAVVSASIGNGAILPAHLGGTLSGGIAITGQVGQFFQKTAPVGWVWADGGTIGSASSGATNRANSDCHDLFVHVWNNADDTDCPVLGGRGFSAEDDWNAHRQITLPDSRDRFSRAWGATALDAGRKVGSIQADQMQGFAITAMNVTHSPANVAVPSSGIPLSIYNSTALTPKTDGVNGTPRLGAETRPVNISLGIVCLKL